MARTVTAFLALSFACRIAYAQCSTERGPVKTATDADASRIDSTNASPVSIVSLQSLPAPRPLPQNGRVSPTETTVYSVTATLIGYEAEVDGDYHLVLADEAGRTFIAAIASPSCAAGSPLASQLVGVRNVFDARFRPTGTFQHVNLPVEIRGVGFFDYQHGQSGAAPNGIELHPVTGLNFSPLVSPAPPPAATSRRRVIGRGGPAACSLPSLALSASRLTVCSGEPVILSWQASDPTATVAIDGIGAALPSSGSTTVGATSAMAYSARARNACGTGLEAVAVVTVQQGASASVSAPPSIQQGASVTVSLSLGNASNWTLTSSLGNGLSPSSGSSNGALSVSYAGSRSGTDTITLTAVGPCGSIQREATIVVGSPPPPPPTSGYLRCCDGTLSPTCTNCASKQGCCSHHGGVCGCL